MSVALGSLAASPAYAICIAPPFDLVWSYPADGAVDVPINAQFFMAAMGQVPCRATLDDATRVIEPKPPVSQIDLGPLQPQHDYQLTLDCPADAQRDAGIVTRVIHFRTGDGIAIVPAAVAVTGWQAHEVTAPEMKCEQLLASPTCPDMFEAFDVQLEVAPADGGGDVIAYELGGSLWPASCGLPTRRLYAVAGECFDVRSVSAAGEAATATRYCIPTDAKVSWTPLLDSGHGGCGLAGHPRRSLGGPLVVWATLLALGLRRVRRRNKLK